MMSLRFLIGRRGAKIAKYKTFLLSLARPEKKKISYSAPSASGELNDEVPNYRYDSFLSKKERRVVQ
jgi:hypothetical protein